MPWVSFPRQALWCAAENPIQHPCFSKVIGAFAQPPSELQIKPVQNALLIEVGAAISSQGRRNRPRVPPRQPPFGVVGACRSRFATN